MIISLNKAVVWFLFIAASENGPSETRHAYALSFGEGAFWKYLTSYD